MVLAKIVCTAGKIGSYNRLSHLTAIDKSCARLVKALIGH
jgi:hypothetical protein